MIRKKIKTGLPQLQNKVDALIDSALENVHRIASSLGEALHHQGTGRSRVSSGLHQEDGTQRISEALDLIHIHEKDLLQSKLECSQAVRTLDKEVNELESRAHSFQKLYETGLTVTAELDPQRILEFGMEAAIDITNAKRGYIALVTQEGELDILAARNIGTGEGEEAANEISRTIVEEVIRTNAPIEIADAIRQDDLRHAKSVEGFKLRSILCVPFESGGEVLGVIYLDNKESGGVFTAESTAILKAFAKQIAVAVKKGIAFQNMQAAHASLMESLRTRYDFSGIIGHSESLRHVLELVGRVADTVANVLILGESGTGKELIAYALHGNSARKDRPFVVVNAAAIPEHLLESELFGYEKGAFTGAMAAKPGKFELANGGTLFLDEIGDMSIALQAKLLRAVQQRMVERLGGTKPIPVDIRIIAATNRDIPKMIEENLFREDLYYRLNVVSIVLPPLRDRREDIPLLAHHFLKRFAAREGKAIMSVSPKAMACLESHTWPGNTRQLENTIERAVILCPDEEISSAYLPKDITGGVRQDETSSVSFNTQINDFKRIILKKALQSADNNKSEAAKQLGLSRSYFYELLAELDIE